MIPAAKGEFFGKNIPECAEICSTVSPRNAEDIYVVNLQLLIDSIKH
jgi:hypothetical protein